MTGSLANASQISISRTVSIGTGSKTAKGSDLPNWGRRDEEVTLAEARRYGAVNLFEFIIIYFVGVCGFVATRFSAR